MTMRELPNKLVNDALMRFGIDTPTDLVPWPYPVKSDDLLARFTFRGQEYFLKRRSIEQRGERSLFETQYILKELLKRGVAAPPLWESPNRETLINGTDWETNRQTYYEIQHHVPGTHLQLTKENAHAAGAFVSRFHQAGDQIDTFLLGKAYWTQTFMQRRFRWFKPLIQRLRDRKDITGESVRDIETRMHRHSDMTWRKKLTWGLTHGNLCSNNLLVSGDDCYLIDFEETGRAELADEAAILLTDLPGFDATITENLLRGYRDAGGSLSSDDLTSIVDGFIFGALDRLLKERDPSIDLAALAKRYSFVLDC
jgi:Ser/Thr protein kinase RdoA (MazF antagonist)